MNIQTWGYIRHLYFAERFPKKAIARELNLDPKTVRRALKKDHPDRKNPEPRPSKLVLFKEKIAELLASYPRMSAVRMQEEITKAGYPGGITILRSHLRDIRPQKKAFLHIQTLPGEEAQEDWAYAGRIGDRPLYCFLMVLSFSRMLVKLLLSRARLIFHEISKTELKELMKEAIVSVLIERNDLLGDALAEPYLI